MPNPVVHFEIGSADSAKSQEFYSSLFGWEIAPGGPKDYRAVDLPDWAGAGYWVVRPLRAGGRRLRRFIPADDDSERPTKNLGIYLGTPPGLVAPLLRFAETPPGRWEELERLEQLRLLEAGETILVEDIVSDIKVPV